MAPGRQRSLQRVEGVSLTDDELRLLMRAAAGHRFFPIYWRTAMTGMRRSEVFGLKWPDIDVTTKRLHLNRELVAVGYELHQTRGKTETARRSIALDDTTIEVLAGWRRCPHRPHDADVPAPPARDAGRRRERDRTPRPTRSTGRTRHGGTSEEQPEEERLIR